MYKTPSVCTFKTSPCVPAPRTHVSTCVRVVLVHTGTCGVDTRAFQCVTHHTPHNNHTQQHHTQQHHTTTQDTTHHNNTTTNTSRKQRQTETERDRERRRRQKEKRREKIHFQCGGAWLFFVDLNRVNCDSSFISFSASWPVNSFYFLRINFLCSYSFHFL